jgi:hypothetical protein
MKLEFSEQIFEKSPNVKFHKIPPSGSRVVPCTETDGQTDMAKLLVPFCDFSNAPKNDSSVPGGGVTPACNPLGRTMC